MNDRIALMRETLNKMASTEKRLKRLKGGVAETESELQELNDKLSAINDGTYDDSEDDTAEQTLELPSKAA